MVYLITFDLNHPSTSRKQVEKTIKESATAWCSFWKSSYLIKSSLASSQIIEKVKPILDDTDRLFIVESTNNYQGWLTDEQWKFIERNIFK